MKSTAPVLVTNSLFEEDYLLRTLGSIANSPDVALTELVANAWDAGASRVDIAIPLTRGSTLVVEDDGCGMTREQFHFRWMRLGYNRQKHQGNQVEFPPERKDWTRPAFGRNGVGRHGLLCFAQSYQVETKRDGSISSFEISTASGINPFILVKEEISSIDGHGTKLTVTVSRHLPNPDKIREILSARFLHDPQFVVYVNGKSVPLSNLSGLIERTLLSAGTDIGLEAFFIDATKSARTIEHQGIAFWVGTRLVGSPSWTLGNTVLLDGRTRLAKRFTIVIKTNDLFDLVLPDWSGFRKSETMDEVYSVVSAYVRETFARIASHHVQETSEEALRGCKEELKELLPLAKLEVAQFVEEITTQSPTIQPETLSLAIRAVINLERSRSGAALLEKLTNLDDSDIVGLDRLLSEWSVRDALNVLDEIDKRLRVIEAIGKLSTDEQTDELHTLHPLVTQSRWLFGPEFDSPEYASNVSLKNAAKQVFGQSATNVDFINARQRPDLVIREDSTFSVVGTEKFDSSTNNLTYMRDVLIIELKKGHSSIGRSEIFQAISYVEDFLNCGFVDGPPFIRAYVVGHKLNNMTEPVKTVGEPVKGRVEATTYDQLVRTAHQRLFKLKEKIPSRYDDLSGGKLLQKILSDTQESLFD